MATFAVISEHLMLTIAYETATLQNCMRMQKEVLVIAGLRSEDIDGLVTV